MARFHRIGENRVQFTQEEEDAQDIIRDECIAGRPARYAQTEIIRLEETITNRRLREALATDDGKAWVADVETLIAVERAKL